MLAVVAGTPALGCEWSESAAKLMEPAAGRAPFSWGGYREGLTVSDPADLNHHAGRRLRGPPLIAYDGGQAEELASWGVSDFRYGLRRRL